MQTETNHALEQAKAQCQSIVEMVAGLDREKAANAFIAGLSEDERMALWKERNEEQESEDEYDEATLISEIDDGTFEPSSFEFDEDSPRQTIMEDPLSILVRSGWCTPGDEMEAEEAEILLCTGGPAVRILCDVDQHGEMSRPRVQYQDWGTPWTEYFPTSQEREALEIYVSQFPLA